MNSSTAWEGSLTNFFGFIFTGFRFHNRNEDGYESGCTGLFFSDRPLNWPL